MYSSINNEAALAGSLKEELWQLDINAHILTILLAYKEHWDERCFFQTSD